MTSGERCLPLEGAFNVRDLGGYATDDGRVTRWGRVFRADALHLLTPSDIETLGAIGIRAVYDLRRAHERRASPTALPPTFGHRDVHLDVLDDPEWVPGPSRLEVLLEGGSIALDVERMTGRYIDMLSEGAAMFGSLLASLAAPDGLPAIFHCAAGKDRTGLAAALVLAVCGVPRSTIVEDYDATNHFRTDRYLERMRPSFAEAGVDVDELRASIVAEPAVLEGALDWMDHTCGGARAYLTERAGVPAPALDRLRALLVM